MEGKILEYLMETFEDVPEQEQLDKIATMSEDDISEFCNTVVVVENTSKAVMDLIWDRLAEIGRSVK